MKRIIKIIFFTALVITVSILGTKLYFVRYEKLADDRIEKVIEFQGAKLSSADTRVNVFDSKNSCWLKMIYFKDDPEIRYNYEYEQSANKVRVYAMYKNMSLDLAGKKAKYPLVDVFFDEKGNIQQVEDRR
jgi:Protein of unknown function (DUF3139)